LIAAVEKPTVLPERRRLSETNAVDHSRIVQWEHSFRQPAHGDQQSELFTGPTVPDCSNDNVPNSHCCRARTTFWISKDEPENYEDPNGNEKYWFGYQGVTKCREICEQQHLRTGHDTQCVPVTEECNNWEGLDGNAFKYSSLVLQEAYCLCGMKLSEVPFTGRRDRELSWQWPDAAEHSIDDVTGGHVDTNDQCYASSIKFRTDVSAAMDDADIKNCPTTSGTPLRYTEMSYSNIQQTDPDNLSNYNVPYGDCFATTETDDEDCCATDRVDRMATHYFERDMNTQFLENAAVNVFKSKRPFGNAVSTSGTLFVHDFNDDKYSDVVIGNRLFLSSGSLHNDAHNKWNEYTQLGEEFGTKPIVAIDAHRPELEPASFSQFVCIAYDDNSVVLYKATNAPLITFFMTLSPSDIGTPTSCRLFSQAVVVALQPYIRLSALVTYMDHPDEIHNYEYPVDSSTGYKSITSVVRPFDDTHTDEFANTPSLSSALFKLPSRYPYTRVVPKDALAGPSYRETMNVSDTSWYAAVGTPLGFFNQMYLEIDGFQPRPLGSTSNTMTSVAVSTLTLDELHSTYVCFANLQSQNLCISIDKQSDAFLSGTRVPDMTVASTELFFGDEPTSGIQLLITDSGFGSMLIDVYTIEVAGYVRVYRGSEPDVLNLDVMPEPLEASSTKRQLTTPPPQTFNTANLDGTERFLAQSTFAFGSSMKTTTVSAPSYLIVHHYNPLSIDGGSCSQRCHKLDRLGYDTFLLFGPDIRGPSTGVTIEYYTNGDPTRCLCGPKYDALKAPFPPPAPPETPPPPRTPPSPPPAASPSMPPPSPPLPVIRYAIARRSSNASVPD